jgi:hypothetical protein
MAESSPARKDHEPLTDLASVFFGFGTFAANAALDFTATSRFDSKWRAAGRVALDASGLSDRADVRLRVRVLVGPAR